MLLLKRSFNLFMESDKFRFKNDNNDKSVRCFKVNFYTINRDELKSISDRLKKVEDTLDDLITGSSFYFEEGKDINRNKNESCDKVIVNLNHFRILKYEDYQKQLMRFYFIYQYYYTSLSMFSINEHYECMNRFHNKPPTYLVYAILSKSSLNSPCSQLYTKNLDYFDYYYELSVKYLNISMSNSEIDIYMLHTLLILMWIDENLNRQYISMSRVFNCVKLVQAMGLDIGDLNLNAKKANLSKFNLIKLLSIIDYNNNEVSKIFNLPKTNIFKRLDHSNYIKQIEEKNNKFLDQSSSLIPKEYYLTYEANEFYLNFHLTHINPLERDLSNKSVALITRNVSS
ncbi:hypothetical protein CONCODRAFT_70861 [Conidiobolus coronatus NRRL 28638]|uniref:Transcription factor domain-containing protein n=1 Tax=Conidiobolus coronatus (strain ATCC 28846 / CBS 209.66 / NRRL 28638) TaxID=796925 RepID=A0A137P5C9_CONC2|nr:hypothetical protein CONCODRAFT_70861 [Conidiobolus coronatus NRRL 28638]|eukprot:KXN70222.1 hypothetical protein CONCODRAFT_70861 [Conidiobolus coronatus NRRL 28638]